MACTGHVNKNDNWSCDVFGPCPSREYPCTANVTKFPAITAQTQRTIDRYNELREAINRERSRRDSYESKPQLTFDARLLRGSEDLFVFVTELKEGIDATQISGIDNISWQLPYTNNPRIEGMKVYMDELRKNINILEEACMCDCAYCTCDCDYCSCNCDYCTCVCNYCVCNCNYH